MAYPGNVELSSQAQERVVTAFRQVVMKLQDGQREEALIGLEFVLRLDPDFRPAVNLHKQLASGAAEIDLSEIIAQLQAPTTEALNTLLVEAVEDYNQRNFVAAKEKVEQVLLELPGHQDARQLLSQIQEALKVETQVAQFLAQAREALDQGDPQEGANFVMMAQALDPHHPGIEGALQEIYAAGLPAAAAAIAPDANVSFDTVSDDDGFGVRFDADEAPPGRAARQDQPPVPPPSLPVPAPAKPTPAKPTGGGLWDEPEPTATDDDIDGVADLFDSDGDVADLFQAGPEEAPAAHENDNGNDDDGSRQELATLLEQGEKAYSANDYMGAVDAWSRILLSDPEHRLAAERIEDARRRMDEVERRVEHILFDVHDALVSGDVAVASQLLAEARVIAPHHLRAEELRQRLADESAATEQPAAPGPAMPDLDDDLFREELAVTSELNEAALDFELPAVSDQRAPAPPPRPMVGRRAIPWRIVAAAAAGLVVILVGVWLGSLLLGGSTEPVADQQALNELLAQAETLYQQHKVEEAAHLLLQYTPANDLDRTRVERRLSKYQSELAPPTPTPIPPSLSEAEGLLADGHWYTAFKAVAAGLAHQPNDPGLGELRNQILEIEPDVAAAQSALAADNPRAAVGLLEDLLVKHSDQPEIRSDLARALYNAALAELRVYNLTGAEGMLRRLDSHDPDDHEVDRILEFIDEYKTRPVDMRLQIFIRNLEPR